MKPRCANCDGYGWVCENHPDVPWEGVAGYGCDCGAGMPCSCNDADPPWDFDSEALAGIGGEEAVSDYIDPQRRALESRKAGLCCCHRCLDERREMRAWMVVCPICGNKRCPKASNHDLLCTASNEPGQPGSVY